MNNKCLSNELVNEKKENKQIPHGLQKKVRDHTMNQFTKDEFLNTQMDEWINKLKIEMNI